MIGKIVEMIGPRLAANRKAIRNLKAALHYTDKEAEVISKDMWNNLGRVMAEFPHLPEIVKNHVTFKGLENIEKLRDDGQCGILFGAHVGNWEILPHALLHHADFAMHPVYRPPNNPMVDKKLHQHRSPDGQLIPYSKSRKGMTGMVRALKKGDHLGILIDQKYNEGKTFPFFEIPARTGTAFAELALKYNCPLVPLRCIREENGSSFIIEALPPIPTLNRTVEDIIDDAHRILEGWIRENPSQWLWLHRRWRKEDLEHANY